MPTTKDIIVRKPSDAEKQTCQSWPVWECGVSEFDWEYTQTEKCLILQGKVTIAGLSADEPSVSFGPGDYVIFPDGLKCIWKILEPVKKYYDFD